MQSIKSLNNELGGLRGRAHRLRQSAVVLWEEAVVLATPPGTDAIQYGFHLGVEGLCTNFLTEDFTRIYAHCMSVECNAYTRDASLVRRILGVL